MRKKRAYVHRAEWLEPWTPGKVPAGLSAEALWTLVDIGRLEVLPEAAARPRRRAHPVVEERRRRWLAERINQKAPDLRTLQTHDEALQHFRRMVKGRADVNDARFVRTFIWQFVVRVLAGEERPIRGNLRSIWYRELRSVLLRLGLMNPEDDPTDSGPQVFIEIDGRNVARPSTGTDRGDYLLDLMEDAFQEMFQAGFYRYSDLEVYDGRENFWSLGTTRANIILFTEKEGLFWLCRELQNRYGVTVIASRGSPIWITVDFVAQALRRRGYSNLILVCLTDYDPWGDDIARQIQVKFADPVLGFRSARLKVLTNLALFTPERLEKAKRYLLVGHEGKDDPVRTVVERWVARGGGINGEPYGIHVDHAEPDLVLAAFDAWLKNPDARRSATLMEAEAEGDL